MGECPPKVCLPIQSVPSAMLNPRRVAAASRLATEPEVAVQVTNLRTRQFSPSLLGLSAGAATALAPRGRDRKECKAAGAVK